MAGEKRMDLKVVPPYNVRVSPDIAVIPVVSHAPRDVRVTVSNNQKGPSSGAVSLQAPAGWRVEPASAAVAFGREDEQATVKFAVTPGSAAGRGVTTITATMTGENQRTSDLGYEVIEYPHIHRQHFLQRAAMETKLIDVAIAPNLHVGYIMGVGDQVPQAIAQLGAQVDLIDADTLAFGDLSRYDVIVTGVRAYERRPDLRANNRRLIQYAESGGTVLVQYNKFEFNDAQYGPYPAKVSADRVTDENAPIEVLVPDDPVFNRPNKIGPESWAGLGAGTRPVFPRRAGSAICRSGTDPRIRFRSTDRRRPVRSLKPRSARAAGFTSASGCGGNCRPVPRERIA